MNTSTDGTTVLAGVATPRIGLGCMGMSDFYGQADDARSLEALHHAFELGYRHFDTADMYGRGANEMLLARFLRDLGPRRDQILLATKVGIERVGDGAIRANSRPAYIRQACDESLQRLGVERIDLLYLHRKSPDVDIEDTIGAMQDLVHAGKIGSIGLSEVSAQTLERACKAGEIEALQSEYSLWTRDVEQGALQTCMAHGVKLVAYSPLGRGFLTGSLTRETIARPGDLRGMLPRFQGDNFDANERLLSGVRDIAAAIGRHPAQVSLAWLMGRSPFIHAIPGSTRAENMACNFACLDVRLDEAQRQALDQAFAGERVQGTRYPSALLGTVNV